MSDNGKRKAAAFFFMLEADRSGRLRKLSSSRSLVELKTASSGFLKSEALALEHLAKIRLCSVLGDLEGMEACAKTLPCRISELSWSAEFGLTLRLVEAEVECVKFAKRSDDEAGGWRRASSSYLAEMRRITEEAEFEEVNSERHLELSKRMLEVAMKRAKAESSMESALKSVNDSLSSATLIKTLAALRESALGLRKRATDVGVAAGAIMRIDALTALVSFYSTFDKAASARAAADAAITQALAGSGKPTCFHIGDPLLEGEGIYCELKEFKGFMSEFMFERKGPPWRRRIVAKLVEGMPFEKRDAAARRFRKESELLSACRRAGCALKSAFQKT